MLPFLKYLLIFFDSGTPQDPCGLLARNTKCLTGIHVFMLGVRTERHCVFELPLHCHFVLLVLRAIFLTTSLAPHLIVWLWQNFSEAGLTWSLDLVKSSLYFLSELHPV